MKKPRKNDNAHRAKALVSVNVEYLLTNWEIGGYLSAKIKHDGWGKSTIDNLVDYLHTHAPSERGYGRSNLYSMVAVTMSSRLQILPHLLHDMEVELSSRWLDNSRGKLSSQWLDK